MLRVLVADDEIKVAQLICNLIDWPALGMQLLGTAHNGLQALELIQAHRPDILITDIRMPGCDGLQLIEKAKALYPRLSIIIISGYRQFDYAQTAMRFGVCDYLLKPIQKDELHRTLEKLARSQQNSAQNSTLGGRHGENAGTAHLRAGLFARLQEGNLPSNLGEINRNFGYQFCEGVFQMVLVKADGNYESLSGEGLRMLQRKMEGILRAGMIAPCCEAELIFENSTARLLLNYPAQKAPAVRKALHTMLEQLRVQNSMFPSVVFTIALGGAKQTLAALWQSALEAQATMEGRLLGTAGGLLDVATEAQKSLDRSTFVAEATKQMKREMERMDAKALGKALEDCSNCLLAQLDLTGPDVPYIAKELCHSYLWQARELQLLIPDSTGWYQQYALREEVCCTAREVMHCLCSTIEASFAAAVQQKQAADSKPIHLAKRYIATHYMQPLALEDVAEEAGFNPSYFSTLFKKETGQNFSEYLTATRVEKAKELLRDTKLPLADICEAVGYLDRKHFAATFKKLTGIKPGEYRKLYA